MDADTPHDSNRQRSDWMSVLARAEPQDIDNLWEPRDKPLSFEWLHKPETGLVMVQGRAGGTGDAFNLGEMTVTRCTLRLAGGWIGYAYVKGRDHNHAERAALLDALLQQAERRGRLFSSVIEPLRSIQKARQEQRSRKAASTKVEFFTVARGSQK
ncbi:phosphonate metabolism PhnG [Mesorhizobium tianshanense]|uniref:Alpha-D-ribose 1-methylphosphonate 5-triphosphate synthase subunit PhnG n=1 Tax=Mesorhizobium tianshanense TaxID=39844 RepID=A0A562NMC5_9HYPH|nr:phosphonate C-P lyase system protein PhnG [Mesorhizobium tianshanense]TWI33131.1 alpha-D-ribose 1-methylphosphonate 5-triphosphate synthase subunit PhnG [Mesorhizobium tianshanense]GLS34997.1 phosphonate metabolism PhnG [Mesorhizobium tianshanense]